MKVLLIDPAGNQTGVTHNAGLAFLSGSLYAKNHDVLIIDLNNYHFSSDDLKNAVIDFSPDFIGFSVKTALVSSAEKTAGLLREMYPNVPFVIGGPHVSILKIEYLQSQSIYNYGIIGEGEITFIELVEGKSPENIAGLIYKKSGEWTMNPVNLINNLDLIPFPTYSGWLKIDRSLFPYPLVHSRGCPYGCSFCSVDKITGRRFRKRSPENVINELRYARKEYVFKNFEFIDDNFTLLIDHAKEVCEALIQADLGVGWYANNGIRADRLDRELVILMKRSGCLGVAVGIESANDDILLSINKGETIEDLRKGISLLKNEDIIVGGHFIIGLPGDTLEKVKNSIKFRDEVGLDYAYFNQLVPYPGTKVYEWAQKHATILVDNLYDHSHFGGKPVVLMETPEFRKNERQEIMDLLSVDSSDNEIDAADLQVIFSGRNNLQILIIRSARMQPYNEIKELFPNATIDILVAKSGESHHDSISRVFVYPKQGLMQYSKIPSNIKKSIQQNYDFVIYLNAMQSNMNFDNVIRIAKKCGNRVFEMRPGLKFKEVRDSWSII